MYRKYVLKAIKHAGLAPWPKLFQNCRSSRETELAEDYPIQVVCSWIGNSPQVAAKHYLQVTEAHFPKAVQFPVQHTAVSARTASHGENGDESNPCVCRAMQEEAIPCEGKEPRFLGVTGLEQNDITRFRDNVLRSAGDVNGANSDTSSAIPVPEGLASASDIRFLLARWTGLPAPIKAGILAAVEEPPAFTATGIATISTIDPANYLECGPDHVLHGTFQMAGQDSGMGGGDAIGCTATVTL